MSKMHTLGSMVATAAVVMAQMASAQAPPQRVPVDQSLVVAGVDVACTGIGKNAREDPRWKAYSVRVVFSNPAGDLVTDATLGISDAKGQPMLNVSCAAPWVLLKLQPGTYRMTARREAPGVAASTAVIRAPASGQVVVNAIFRRSAG